jgi:ribosomal protein L11 methyltransferase
VSTSAEAEEALTELLAGLYGSSPATYRDAETGLTSVSVFLKRRPAESAPGKIRQAIRNWKAYGLDTGSVKVRVRRLQPQDWAESWKRHFAPLEIGSALLVRPSWSRKRPRQGQREIVIDPGLSFGTGQHPTTKFCLEQIAATREITHDQSFLDIGTGSGILAMAAAKLGYRPVAAFDNDPEAVRTAVQNARANGVGRALEIRRQDLKQLPPGSQKRYSLVCANLLFTLLIEERNKIISRLSLNGTLVIAGVLRTEFTEVRQAYEQAGLKLLSSRSEKEWMSAAFRR